MRRVLWCVLLAACGESAGSDYHPDDAPPGGTSECDPPSALPLCTQSCGNGQAEWCVTVTMTSSSCRHYDSHLEVCDGAAPEGATCEAQGYYTGEVGCNATCTGPDFGRCGFCAPGITCANSVYGGGAVAVSGNHLATLGDGHIAFFFGTTPTTSTIKPASSIAATATGWLVGDGATLQPMAFDGTLGTFVSAPAGSRIAPGPGDRLTVVDTNNLMTEVSLVDATGAAVTGPVQVFASTTAFGAATDGTHAFVGGVGTLAIVAYDGATTTHDGFPEGDVVAVSWDGTTGWYVTGTEARRFDSAGAFVGAPIALPSFSRQAIADGADLVIVIRPSQKTLVQRVHADGTSDAPVELGAGVGAPYAARIAGQLVVVWATGSQAVLAIVP